jgi:hypothetical protein
MKNSAKVIYLEEYRQSRERRAIDLLAMLDRNLSAYGIRYEDHSHLWKALGMGPGSCHAESDPPDDGSDTPQSA